jgi:hypothetical protein
MSGFIAWLFFGGQISLPEAVTVTQQCMTITPKKAMVVKGDGAELVIELPFLPHESWPEGIMSRLERIAREYPSGRITADFYHANGTKVSVTNAGKAAGKKEFQLFLAPAGGFSEGDEFVNVRVCANPSIHDAHLFWRRVGK